MQAVSKVILLLVTFLGLASISVAANCRQGVIRKFQNGTTALVSPQGTAIFGVISRKSDLQRVIIGEQGFFKYSIVGTYSPDEVMLEIYNVKKVQACGPDYQY